MNGPVPGCPSRGARTHVPRRLRGLPEVLVVGQARRSGAAAAWSSATPAARTAARSSRVWWRSWPHASGAHRHDSPDHAPVRRGGTGRTSSPMRTAPSCTTAPPTESTPPRSRWIHRSTSRSIPMPPGCDRVTMTQRATAPSPRPSRRRSARRPPAAHPRRRRRARRWAGTAAPGGCRSWRPTAGSRGMLSWKACAEPSNTLHESSALSRRRGSRSGAGRSRLPRPAAPPAGPATPTARRRRRRSSRPAG